MAADDKGADPEIGGQLRRLEVVGIDSEKNKAQKYLWSHICKIVVSWCVGPVLDAPRQWRGWNMCHICFARRRPYAGKFFEIHHRKKVGRLLMLFKLVTRRKKNYGDALWWDKIIGRCSLCLFRVAFKASCEGLAGVRYWSLSIQPKVGLVQNQLLLPLRSLVSEVALFLIFFVFLKVSLRYSHLLILILYNYYWRIKWKKFFKIDVSLFLYVKPWCSVLWVQHSTSIREQDQSPNPNKW